jgi:hypothetical protein
MMRGAFPSHRDIAIALILANFAHEGEIARVA